MKNRQFIVLCLLIVVWFIILYFKIDQDSNIINKHTDYLWNIDNNVVNVDEFIHRKLDTIY